MRFFKLIGALCIGAFLAGCGGGGGSAGTSQFGTGSGTGSTSNSGGTSSSTSTVAAVISVALSNTTVTSASPATVTATVVDSNGNALANQVVTFATKLGYGVLSAPTALTNASGQAVVTLTPSTSTTIGADTVSASVTVNAATVSASTGFQLTETNVSISSFTADIGSNALTAYGQTALSVTVTGAATGASINLSVTSACVTAGKATLSPATATTTTGSATFIYKDSGGCGSTLSSDTLQVTVAGSSVSKTLSLALTSPAASSITFVPPAAPVVIYLAGSGYTSTAPVSFKVVDLAGNALPGQSVTLVATTYTGGLTLDGVSTPITKISDANGQVSVLVNSGTIPTPVRVTATLLSLGVSTTSSSLAIAVGLPTQTAFSLSQKTLNIEGMNIDGTSNTYTVIASDRMGNPVPAGTSVNFVADSGQIASVGSTTVSPSTGLAGTTVNYQSSSPRPKDGRITVVAYALGEESFIDNFGTNTYQAGDDFQDLGDVFVSQAYSVNYNQAIDQRIVQTVSTPATCHNASASSLQLDASIPSVETFNGAPRCDGVWGQAYVRRAAQTVLSTSAANPQWLGVGGSSPLQLDGACSLVTVVGDTGATTSHYKFGSGTLYGLSAGGGVLSVLLADANPVRLNPMAAGTTVKVSASSNITVVLLGGSPVPSTLSANAASFSYAFTSGNSGTVTVSVTSPSGLTTTATTAISTGSPPTACPY